MGKDEVLSAMRGDNGATPDETLSSVYTSTSTSTSSQPRQVALALTGVQVKAGGSEGEE